jgi:hypothetical protein
MPFLTEGAKAFNAAREMLAAKELDKANQRQFEGIAALQQARERFLDIRGLVELAHANELQVRALLSPPEQENGQPEIDLAQFAKGLQDKNVDRGERLAKLIDLELRPLQKDGKTTDSAAPSAQDAGAATERQRLELAQRLLASAQTDMTSASEALGKLEAEDESPSSPDASKGDQGEKTATRNDQALADARASVGRAIEHLQALRRLFFSIVEHLRETAQRQAQLNDETEQAAALSKADQAETKVAPLTPRQQELKSISDEIAKALQEQSQQDPAALAGGGPKDANQQEHWRRASEQLAQAGELVAAGAEQMQRAVDAMSAEPPELKPTRECQDAALKKLAEALALLVPPQLQPEQQDKSQGQDEDKEKKQKEESQVGADPARLLQAVRDREARRRREKSRSRADYEPVEKDW